MNANPSAQFRIHHRSIPLTEGVWNRPGQLARIRLIDLEPALPPRLRLEQIRSFRVTAPAPDGSRYALASYLDYPSAFRLGEPEPALADDTLLCFHTPSSDPTPSAIPRRLDPGWRVEGQIDLRLWDSRAQARLEGIQVEYSIHSHAPRAKSPHHLRLAKTARGYAVKFGRSQWILFDAHSEYQICYAAPAGKNLVPIGKTWRYLPTETLNELHTGSGGQVRFTPLIKSGPVLVIHIQAQVKAGQAESLLRIFRQAGTLVLEFDDYRTRRTRPELPPDQHPRCYAGQPASPLTNGHYAAFVVALSASRSRVEDHLFETAPIPSDHALSPIYVGDRNQKGWNWVALTHPAGTIGLSAHGRTHYPDHQFKAGRDARQRLIALEPWGSEVDGHYQACDRHLLILAQSTAQVREVFDTLDTFPILAAVPVRRPAASLDTFACLGRWINLNLDHLMKPGRIRNAVRTDGTFRNDADTCMSAVGEMIRLYEKTGWLPFQETALSAARFAAQWILDGKFNSRGAGVGANGGGIYQNEQIYLLLSLARVYRAEPDPLLKQAIDAGVDWLDTHRGGQGTWGWDQYSWHAGGWGPDGKGLFFWPVNSNQFATLNFRLFQLLGDRAYYEKAMAILEDYRTHQAPGSWEIIKGGGVSDTTRGIHLFAEAIEVAGKDPRLDPEFLRRCIENTLDRFWIEGWVLIRHSFYGEAIEAGDTPGQIFSPGFHHWHNCGSHLDPIPRIAVAAEAGVSLPLSRWAMRDLAYDFDPRFGFEEHTHLSRFSMRDTDIEPACHLDAELLPALYALHRQGGVAPEDFQLLHYKIHRMLQRTFIPLDSEHGGWANYYDSQDGAPIKYLAYWETRHSFEHFAPDEPRELWGVPTRDAFYDHFSHYWTATEALVDELLSVETLRLEGERQILACRADEGSARNLPISRPVLIPRASGATTAEWTPNQSWQIQECREVTIGGQSFWLMAVGEAPDLPTPPL